MTKKAMAFMVEEKIGKKLKKISTKCGFSMSEVVRRGIVEQINQLESDGHD